MIKARPLRRLPNPVLKKHQITQNLDVLAHAAMCHQLCTRRSHVQILLKVAGQLEPIPLRCIRTSSAKFEFWRFTHQLWSSSLSLCWRCTSAVSAGRWWNLKESLVTGLIPQWGHKPYFLFHIMFPLASWNDRRSRRVFLCFYSAIFQLKSAKFQTFAYNSSTVRSSYMKFWQRFEINELYVCTKFRGNRSRDFGFRTRKPPRKFGVKSGLSQKRFKYGKKYFTWLYVLRYPFIPTNPLLAAMRFFFFFSS